ncbi:MAG: monooxygenase [Methylothermaceae bacteria B42]|nr:MAG: monooxygenase [Methylothermaceae bacteria B42]HHJ40377.1 NAD(P)/FAD-dependent oxidoreductase [Methylothermaceae bacterium]
MNPAPIPRRCDVAIIGAGPAGSSAAALLAKAGIDTVVLERARHPRPMVGESLIPHFWKYTDLTGASAKIEQEGFIAKAGGITVWEGGIHRIAFSDFGFKRPALHVERDRFDHLLLQHARECGAQIFEGTPAVKVNLSGDNPRISYLDRRGSSPVQGELSCRYMIDASGASTLVARQSRSKRLAKAEHQFLSFWGYFDNARFLAADGRSYPFQALTKKAPVTFVLSYEDGWIWHIPLRHKTSVGLVVYRGKLENKSPQERLRYFHEICRKTPYLRELLQEAAFIGDSLGGRPDFSYHVEALCRENVYCIGDAGGFVDPIFSHGVLNAFYSAAVAALAIQESLRHRFRQHRCAQLCEAKIREFYSFSRALALGDFDVNGVEINLIKRFMRSVPKPELELMLAASHMTHRSKNFRAMLAAAGLDELTAGIVDRARILENLII